LTALIHANFGLEHALLFSS